VLAEPAPELALREPPLPAASQPAGPHPPMGA